MNIYIHDTNQTQCTSTVILEKENGKDSITIACTRKSNHPTEIAHYAEIVDHGNRITIAWDRI